MIRAIVTRTRVVGGRNIESELMIVKAMNLRHRLLIEEGAKSIAVVRKRRESTADESGKSRLRADIVVVLLLETTVDNFSPPLYNLKQP